MFIYFNHFNIFENKQLQVHYLTSWMNQLKNHDKVLLSELDTSDKINKCIEMMMREPEQFQFPIQYGTEKVLINVRVSPILKILCEELNLHLVQKIPIEYFGNHQKFQWSKVKINVNWPLNSAPIVSIPFYNGRNSYLVIDGNHRIAHHIEKELPTINAMLISECSAIEQNIFTSSFDKMMYIFHNELFHLQNEKKKGKLTDEILVKRSFLSTGTFDFHVS